MKFKEKILECQKSLQEKGFEVIIPAETIRDIDKATASKLHFNQVVDSETDAILAINENKRGIDNYIGPNTFAEIGLAYFRGTRIYLLNDIYEPYQDELIGWNAIPLQGDLNRIEK